MFKVWGATGYTLTQSKLNELISMYPQYVSQSKNGRWLGKTCYDCASFVRFAMKQVGVSMVSGATSQWKKTKWTVKGTIDQLPKDQVACLYRWTGSVMQHTGIYLGNGYVIDARGSSSGVIKTKLESYPWSHWGQPQGLISGSSNTDNTKIEVITVSYQAKVVASSGTTVRMRSAPSKDAATIVAIPLGTTVEVVEEAQGWSGIMYENQKGYMMSEFLEKIGTGGETYYVRIKCSTKAEAEQLATLLRAATAE